MVPNKEAIGRELLKLLSDGKEHCFDEVEPKLAKVFNLSKADLDERISSGYRTRFRSNITWSVTQLVEKKHVERTGRGCFKATTGKAVKMSEAVVIEKTLSGTPSSSSKLPEEIMQDIHEQTNSKLAQEILAEVKNASPIFLETLVLHLLKKMGYGKKLETGAGKRVGGVGDGGIDGFVKEDQLGFDVIYYQAKRWNSNPVSSKEVSAFAGSLDRYHSNKGVFIATSQFSSDAKQYVQHNPKKIILIDGEELARLMIEHGVGVTVAETFQIKQIDTDYFDESKSYT